MSDKDKRPGEVALSIDPAEMAGDASLVFIGRIRSPWKSRAECPRNLVQAREQGKPVTIEIDDVWRAGLMGLEHVSHIIVLYWMQQARRDLIIQIPRNRPDPKGVFSIRSPVRPNSIAMATVRILDVDQKAGLINIDAIDCLDGTPLLDIKPWFEAIDAFPVQDGLAEK